MHFPKRFAEQPRGLIIAEMAVVLAVIVILDFLTTYRIRLLPFYVGPIFVVGWFCRRRAGLLAAFISGWAWWCSNWFNGDPMLSGWIQVWDVFRVFGFLAVVALTGSALRSKSDTAAARIALLEHSNRLERQIVNVAEGEQRRIGQDLHDGLCQYLAALSCSAASLREDLQKSNLDAEAEKAGELARLLQDAVVQTRDLARGLVPAQVAQLGLALETLVQSVTRLHGVHCTFRSHGHVSPPSDEVAMHLYRVAQEAIQNAIKHGKAKSIVLSLKQRGESLTLRVADNGVGVQQGPGSGMGLATMRYRARMNGGDMTIEQPESGGTVISCTVKMRSQTSESAAA